jgi:polysaccharide export outer membrane protein
MVNRARAIWRLGLAVGFYSWLTLVMGCATVPGSHLTATNNSEIRTRAITSELVAKLNTPATTPIHHTELERQRLQYDYVIGPGDVLSITVWNHPELTIPAGSMRSPVDAGNWVHNDGTIFYPYVGSLHVAGLRVTEVREEITKRLRTYIERPQVDVTVAAFRSKRIYVTGAVNRPGTVPITNVPLTLLDAINQAGGLSENADWQRVLVSRNGSERVFNLRQLYQQGDTGQNLLLQPGDLVHINHSDANKIFVLGEVGKPQSLIMGQQGMSLAEALADAGGWNENRSDARGVFVLRRSTSSSHAIDVFQLNARQATALVLADQFPLQERDVIYVTAAPMARWNRVLNLVTPSLMSLYYLDRVGQ